MAEAMLADTVDKCMACGAFDTSLAVAPATDLEWFRARFPGPCEIQAQRGADLGLRLADHFERAHRARPGWSLVVIGSDAPHMPVERIVTAHEALEGGADVVLGPDRGGGYYLVGLRRPRAELFTDVPMSTPDMCVRTRALASTLELSVALLETDYDIDAATDARALSREISRCAQIPIGLGHTARVLRTLATKLDP